MNASKPALVKAEHEQMVPRGFVPSTIEEGIRLGGILLKSGLMPSHIKSAEAAFAILAAGAELGLSPLQSMRSLFFVEGKVTLSADLIVSLAKKHPECEFFRVVDATNESVTCETKRRGDAAPTRMTWTIEDAKRAGLTNKNNWKGYPKAMLRARVSADLARAVYPDALMGVYDEDEMDRGGATAPLARTEVIDVTPRSPAVAPKPELAPMSEDTQDRWIMAAKQAIDALDACHSIDELKAFMPQIKAIPEPFLQPVREAYAARRKALLAEGGAP